MRRVRSSMYATLTIVGLVTFLAVAIALLRAGGEGEHNGPGDPHADEAVTDSPPVRDEASAH